MDEPGDAVPTSVSWVRVRPRQCDAQAMVHAIRYYEYFEDAFLDWLDRFAGGYDRLRAAGADLVIVANGCDYRGSARLGDLLAVQAAPTAAGRTSVSVSFTVRRADPTTLPRPADPHAQRERETEAAAPNPRPSDPVVVLGHATYVAVSAGSSVPLPDPLRDALRSVPPKKPRASG